MGVSLNSDGRVHIIGLDALVPEVWEHALSLAKSHKPGLLAELRGEHAAVPWSPPEGRCGECRFFALHPGDLMGRGWCRTAEPHHSKLPPTCGCPFWLSNSNEEGQI